MREPKVHNNKDISYVREQTIRRLQSLDNPVILGRVNTVLDESATLQRLSHIPAVREFIREEENEDLEIHSHLNVESSSLSVHYDARLAPYAFYLGVASLLLIGAAVTALTEEQLSPLFQRLLPWLMGITGLVYLLNAVDIGLLFYLCRRSKQKLIGAVKLRRLLSLLFPPLRIGSRDAVEGVLVWIPAWHWCKVNKGLFLELKRRFVLPMIAIALLIVPVLIIEWKFLDYIKNEWPDLRIDLILESVQTFIWCTFTFEFLLMISVSDRKLHYIRKNWIDLLIILLPFVSFLRTLRISQIARLKYATRSFKLRGVVTKARQGLIFVDFLQRIFRLRPESELKRLYRLLQENQRDRAELEKKLRQVTEMIEKKENGEKKKES
jgi:hypothetical protein